jgi:fumarate reductase flavoprotein subunit
MRTKTTARSETVDVVVVGGGLAGWVAAVRAHENGARVAVVEKSRRRPGWGNSLLSGGVLHAALRSPYRESEAMASDLSRLTAGCADPEVVEAWSQNIGPTLSWLEERGADIQEDGAALHRAAVLAPIRTSTPGFAYSGTGMTNLLTRLSEGFVRAGGSLHQPARAIGLHPASGRHRWALTIRSERSTYDVHATSVVLADGGIHGSPALVKKYVRTSKYRLVAAGTPTGDGLRMATAVGATVFEDEGFYGHLFARASMKNSRLWPYPILDALASQGIIVNGEGTRIVDETAVDETTSGVHVANEVAHSTSPDTCWIVVDHATWESQGRAGSTPPNPYLLDEGAGVLRAGSLPELARSMHLDETNLVRSAGDAVDRWHSATPARSWAARLAEPPFYAIPIIAGITFAFAGLRVDGVARVLDKDSRPLPGLFAAGGTMGGLNGGPRQGYAGGVLGAAVFGYIAGGSAVS